MKIYLASSWRNEQQPEVLKHLRDRGHEVYDFRNPCDDDAGFHWSDIDPNWENWDAKTYRAKLLLSPVAKDGFLHDWRAMKWADICILLLPSGRSAHIEAGYFVGANKPLIILLANKNEPELMYQMANKIALSPQEVTDYLKDYHGS